jgi:carbonic anhydrase/acetyltransferase-like protein (isoleucine patch superfamily)
MIIEHQGKRPTIHPTAYIAPNAVISGDVTIGAETRVLYGAVITSEGAPARIGKGVVIMENAVIRASGGHSRKFPVTIGDYVFIGPHAHITGATLDYRAYVGTGAVVLNGSEIGRNAAVTIGAIVHIQTRIPDETVVPLQHIVIGNPCKLFAPNDAEAIIDELLRRNFKQFVFGLEDRQILAEHYSRSLGAHLRDRILDAIAPDAAVAAPATAISKPTAKSPRAVAPARATTRATTRRKRS